MKLVKPIKNLLKGLYLGLRRFPMTILLSTSIAVILIYLSELKPVGDTLSKIAMVFALGIPLSLSIKLFFEKGNDESIIKITIVYIFGTLTLALYYFLLLKNLNMTDITRYIAVSLALYLIFLFIPYFPRRESFEMYIITVISGFFITVLYSLVLFGGLSAILFTVDKLLGIQVLGKIYYYTWIFVVFIFAVSYFLSNIPVKDNDFSSKNYPKLLKILLLYIVMPLLTAYTIILYIYFGKIIVTIQWPEGLVSHLVLWYSIIVTLVLFFITPLLDVNGWASKFHKLMPRIIVPLLIMMFISIGIRIRAYGVTERRYYVVILATWIFSIMLYFAFTKKLRNIIIPFTLSIVALLSVFGPISSYSISKYSQNRRLEKILIANNMLIGGTIQNNGNITKEDKVHVTSILEYFNRNHSLNDVSHLPIGFKMEDMNKVFGFSAEHPNLESTDSYFYFTRSSEQRALDIKGYDYLIETRYLMDKNAASNTELNAVYDYESAKIKINYRGNQIYTKDLTVFVNNIIDKHDISMKGNNLSSDEMTFEDENDKIKVRFVFESISGRKNPANQSIDNKSFEFHMMIKIK